MKKKYRKASRLVAAGIAFVLGDPFFSWPMFYFTAYLVCGFIGCAVLYEIHRLDLT